MSSFAGQWPYHSSKAIAIDPQRDLLYLGDGNALNILDFDLNLISSLVVTESSQVGGFFYREIDNLLFVACRTEGVKVYDLTEAENPIPITSFLPDSLETINIFVDGNKAYLASGIDGIIIFDITETDNPLMLSQSGLPGGFGISYAIDIYASGNTAFAADLYNGIHVIDVSDPQKPDYKKGIALAGANDILISKGYLYVTLQSAGMAILDISKPEDTFVASLFAREGVATSVQTDDNFAFISYTSIGIRALDITSKTNPFHDPAWLYETSGGSSLGLLPGSNSLFFANDQFGLQKIDITDKSNLNAVITYDTPADAVAIDVSGNYIYALDDTVGDYPEKEGLRIFEISTSNGAAVFYFKGFCPTPGKAQDVQVSNNYAYIADGDHGIQIIDLSDKTNPYIMGNFDTPGSAYGVFIKGNYAYVADGVSGIAIIDVSDKAEPVQSAIFDTGGNARDIFVEGDYAYVANEIYGVQMINIKDKTDPQIMGTFDTPEIPTGIFINNNYAFVTAGKSGFTVIEITDKFNPISIATFNTDGFAENVSVSGNYAYVADGKNGLLTFDVSNPSQPQIISGWFYDSPGIAKDVFGGFFTEEEELYVFIADSAGGVIAINLSVDEDTSDDEQPNSSSGGCFLKSIKLNT